MRICPKPSSYSGLVPGYRLLAVGRVLSVVRSRLRAVSRVCQDIRRASKQASGSPQMSLVCCRVCPDMREPTDIKGPRRPFVTYAWLRMTSHAQPGGIFRATGQLGCWTTGRSGSQAIRQLDSQAVREPISQSVNTMAHQCRPRLDWKPCPSITIATAAGRQPLSRFPPTRASSTITRMWRASSPSPAK